MSCERVFAMNITSILLGFLLVLNIMLALIVIFQERRDVGSTWAWLLVLFFIPILGFVMYLLLGQNLSRKRLFQWDDLKKTGFEKALETQLTKLRLNQFYYRNDVTRDNHDLIYMHMINNQAILTEDNVLRFLQTVKKNLISYLRI